MITIFDNINDKSNYAAYGGGMISGFIGMVLWVFPILNTWAAIFGALGTLFLTAFTTMTVLIITGLYKKHEIKILNFFEMKIVFINKMIRKNGKSKKSNDRAA